MKRGMMLAVLCWALITPAAARGIRSDLRGHGQQPRCLHGPDETADQAARRRDALHATRTVNNLEANQPGAANKTYLRQAELPTSPFMQRTSDAFVKSLDFTPGHDLFSGWTLTLETSENGYWFMIKDKTDPCGFAYISNTSGLIYTAEPIR